MSWPQTAFLSLSIFWLSLAILLTRWPRHHHKSISKHSAAYRESFIFFTLIQSSVGVITYLFMVLWFVPRFNLSLAFAVLYSIVAWLQIIGALFPDTGAGLKSTIHSKLAYSFALGMIFSSLLLCISSNIPQMARIFFGLSTTFMLYAMAKYLLAKKKFERVHNYLTLQVIFIVSFQVSVLVATFLS